MASIALLLTRLEELRGDFSEPARAEKLRLLRIVADRPPTRVGGLRRWHALLMYLRAFPDDAEVYAHACAELQRFHQRLKRLPASERRRMIDAGIAGTTLCYRYSYDVARWVVAKCPGATVIDWAELSDADALDALLAKLVQPAEELAFTDGGFTARSWFEFARRGAAATDYDWLVQALRASNHDPALIGELFEAADIPVGWRLRDCAWSITRNVVPVRAVCYRTAFRKPTGDAAARIATPLPGIRLLPRAQGRRVIDAAIAALAARQREVYSMNRANPAEVWHAPLGEGADLAVFGVSRGARPVLEGNYGYMLFSNGAPIGYGGVSPLFAQGNTGINVFPEYRRSEAPFLFVETLRAFATLFGCRHFIANPYQFGRDNPEAIASGAYWFYYRLGFRSTDAVARQSAEREAAALAADRAYRSSKQTLRKLAQSDLVLSLPGSDANEIFDERWLVTLARGATQRLAERGARSRSPARESAARDTARELARAIGAASRRRGPRSARQAFVQLAIYVSFINDIREWPRAERRALAELLAAKADEREQAYCQLLARNERFREGLAAWCRAAQR